MTVRTLITLAAAVCMIGAIAARSAEDNQAFEKIERGARVADCDNAPLKAISTVEGLWALGSAGLPFLSESVPQTLKKGALSDGERRKHRRSFPPYQVSSNLEAK